MRVLSAAEVREADRYTIHEIGVPSMVLMENAGRQVAAAMEAWLGPLEEMRIAIVCGRGNNGGDGFVVARTLTGRAARVDVFLVGRAGDLTGDARANLEILGRIGVPVAEVADAPAWAEHAPEVLAADVVVDAIFGTGLRGPLEGVPRSIAADLNRAALPVIAIDMPSGLSSDTPDPPVDAVRAALTVTLAAPKVSQVLPPAAAYCGELVVADIGIPSGVIDRIDGARLEIITREAVKGSVEPRPPDAHKGDHGRVLVIAGSRGKTGAAGLAGLAALRSGAGLVTVATPRVCQPVVATLAPEYMTLALPDEDGRLASGALDALLAEPADVLAIGPGLGTGPGIAALVAAIVERADRPLVLDADALNALAGDPSCLRARRARDIVLTPHPGEMARLLGTTAAEVQADRVGAARGLAGEHGVHVILKGHRTLVAAPDGTVAINMTGNPGMATGGTGDVLTGIVAAWLAQLGQPAAACRLAVYLHGLAGDFAQAARGEVAMTASDLLDHLGDAVGELGADRASGG